MNKKKSLLTKLLLGVFCIVSTQTFTLPDVFSVAIDGCRYIKSSIDPWSLAIQSACINSLKYIADYNTTQMIHRGIQREKILKVYCPEYLEKTVKKMGFRPGDITFYRCNSNIMPLFAKCDEFAIFANNDLMGQLDEKEQQAFIAHELAHIKNNDQLKRNLLVNISTVAIPLTLHIFDTCFQVVSNKIKERSSKYLSDILDTIQKCSACITHSQLIAITLQVYLFFKYSQYQEYQADITAVKKLGTAQPMINAFTRISKQEKLKVKQRKINIPNKIGNFFSQQLHPSLEQRIAYLQKLKI